MTVGQLRYPAIMRRLALAAVPMLLALSACGSTSSASKDSTVPEQASTPAPASSTPPVFTSAAGVAQQAGLQDCSPSDSGHDFVSEMSCGTRAVILYFDSADELSQWESAYLVNGLPDGGGVLYNDQWAVGCPQRSTCAAIKDNLGGGTLKP